MLCGLTHEDFWVNLTPKQVLEYIEKYYARKEQNIQIAVNLLWEHSYNTMIAIQQPSKFPTKPREVVVVEKEKTNKLMTDEELERAIDML